MAWTDKDEDIAEESLPVKSSAAPVTRQFSLSPAPGNWRARTAQIIEAFNVGLALTYVEILTLFPSRFAATKRLTRLWQRKKIKRVALVHGVECGRPRYLYSKRPIKVDNGEHEYGLSRILIAIGKGGISFPFPDDAFSPDAYLTIGKETYFLEYDRDTEKMSYIMKRYEKYRDAPCQVLWVCPTEARREQLRKAAEIVKHNTLFAVESEVRDDPTGRVWLGYSGKRYSVGE
jgi:hypothetical protein